MNTQDSYKLAVQAAFAMAARELLRVEHEEDQHVGVLNANVDSDGFISVEVLSSDSHQIAGYSL